MNSFWSFVQVLDGEAKIAIADKIYELKSGEGIVMPSNIPHAVYAKNGIKFLLTACIAKRI
jgi:quercetin dioxygenase-like cupin family protein